MALKVQAVALASKAPRLAAFPVPLLRSCGRCSAVLSCSRAAGAGGACFLCPQLLSAPSSPQTLACSLHAASRVPDEVGPPCPTLSGMLVGKVTRNEKDFNVCPEVDFDSDVEAATKKCGLWN